MKHTRMWLVLAAALAGAGGLAWQFWIGPAAHSQRKSVKAGGILSGSDWKEGRKHSRIIFGGRLLAELEPCGCTSPRMGGLSRRLTIYERLLRETPECLLVDAGDSLAEPDSRLIGALPDQSIRKAQVVESVYRAFPNAVFCIGEAELLFEGDSLIEKVLSPEVAHILTNVHPADSSKLNSNLSTHATRMAGANKFLITSIMDHEMFIRLDLARQGFVWEPADVVIRDLIKRESPTLVIVAAHVANPASTCAIEASISVPSIVVNVGHQGSASVTNRDSMGLVMDVPLKGTSVLVVDIYAPEIRNSWKNASQFPIMSRYTANLEERLFREKSRDDRDSNEVHRLEAALSEANARGAVQDRECKSAIIYEASIIPLNETVGESKLVLTEIESYKAFVSSLAERAVGEGAKLTYHNATECRACHEREYVNWSKTRHFQAWEILEKEGNRATTDPECLSCHVTGYGFPGGPRRKEEIQTMRSVQCESCHAPRGVHPGKDSFYRVGVSTCLGCHSSSRDPAFRFEDRLVHASCQGPNHVKEGK